MSGWGLSLSRQEVLFFRETSINVMFLLAVKDAR